MPNLLPHDLAFLTGIGQIIIADLLLGGDNAVMIAMAARDLPRAQKRQAVMWGTVGAVVLRVLLVAVALKLFGVPGLMLAGAVLLVGIGARLMVPEVEHEIPAATRLWQAVRTIVLADLLMSVDNVVAIAGAARHAGGEHEILLVALGLAFSVPVIVWGSGVVDSLMTRWPLLIEAGAMMLGWIAGGLATGDPLVRDALQGSQRVAEILGALLVLALGGLLRWRRRRSRRCA